MRPITQNFEYLRLETVVSKKKGNSYIGVQFFDRNSKTNQDIQNRNNNSTLSINSKVKNVKMTLKVFDLDLHRFAHLSNIFNFLRCKPL